MACMLTRDSTFDYSEWYTASRQRKTSLERWVKTHDPQSRWMGVPAEQRTATEPESKDVQQRQPPRVRTVKPRAAEALRDQLRTPALLPFLDSRPPSTAKPVAVTSATVEQLAGLLSSAHMRISDAFHAFDAAGSGLLTRAQWSVAMEGLGIQDDNLAQAQQSLTSPTLPLTRTPPPPSTLTNHHPHPPPSPSPPLAHTYSL